MFGAGVLQLVYINKIGRYDLDICLLETKPLTRYMSIVFGAYL